MTSVVLASLRQADDEYLWKFIESFGRIVVQIRNLNPKVALHSMLLALRPSKFADNPCKKFPGSMDNLSERAKSYIQMEEISRFKNEVRHAGQKHDKQEGIPSTKLRKLKSGSRIDMNEISCLKRTGSINISTQKY